MKPLAGAIGRALHTLRLQPGVDRATAITAWPEAAASVLGPSAAALRALSADESTLLIAAPDAGWAGEIRLRERELIAALGARAPRAGIARIRCAPSEGAR